MLTRAASTFVLIVVPRLEKVAEVEARILSKDVLKDIEALSRNVEIVMDIVSIPVLTLVDRLSIVVAALVCRFSKLVLKVVPSSLSVVETELLTFAQPSLNIVLISVIPDVTADFAVSKAELIFSPILI